VDYVAAPLLGEPARSDRIDSLNVSLGLSFLRRGSIQIIYALTRDVSSLSGYSFETHQIGFDISYVY
jgi:hypothetical protein